MKTTKKFNIDATEKIKTFIDGCKMFSFSDFKINNFKIWKKEDDGSKLPHRTKNIGKINKFGIWISFLERQKNNKVIPEEKFVYLFNYTTSEKIIFDTFYTENDYNNLIKK